ncbi:MAG: hypothetical protein ISR00_04175 [Flavobacteriales bacterium]|nr:hypothetical protein [Flavobacteriales bacterium]
MRKYILLTLFSIFNYTSICQNFNQLICVNIVSNETTMNAISSPQEGNLIYVQSTDAIYYYDGTNWMLFSNGNSSSSNDWNLAGNSIASSNFLGTSNNTDLDIRTNNTQRMTVKNDGKVGVNTLSPTGAFQVGNNQFIIANNGNAGIGINPTEKLHVSGNILASGTITPDYVFESYFEGKSQLKPEYQFTELEKTIEFAKKHHHLPNIPSAKEVKKQGGILLNKAVEQNLEKIEELFLHLYELNLKKDSLKEVFNKKIAGIK